MSRSRTAAGRTGCRRCSRWCSAPIWRAPFRNAGPARPPSPSSGPFFNTCQAGEAMRFVLVHGGWQGGWAWDGVSALLRAGGHEVFAPTLRGLAEGDTGRAGVTLADMAAGLIQEIGEQDLR